MFSTQFISASAAYSSLTEFVSAPYFRRSFEAKCDTHAVLTVCGLGFYEFYLNGERLTKGFLAPYISNPDHILYYDVYDLTGKLREGKNTLGFLLGNGMQNAPGGQTWDFEQARWRSAPKLALSLEAEEADGRKWSFEADEQFRCAPSPIYFDDLRAGEYYDARLETDGWNLPAFDDSGWAAAIPAETPRGECRICLADPIVITEELVPQAIRPAKLSKFAPLRRGLPDIPLTEDEAGLSGYLYDFGVNAAGLVRLKIRGQAGQKIILWFGEALDENGDVDMRGLAYLPPARNQRDIYICRGEGEEVWLPAFTYHGFRYCLVTGITEAQAVPELLAYAVMNSDLRTIGDFSCSDGMLNRICRAARVSDLANFYYFPTDCPHREKNGWTGDAVLSAERMMLCYTPENSYREWMHNIRRAQREDGSLPGFIPTDTWGYRDNGPAWDGIAVLLPYTVWRYRGDTEIIRENAAMMMRYLHYLLGRRSERGLVDFGLGDWLPSARRGARCAKTPMKLTSTAISMDICRKAAICFGAVHMTLEKAFAEAAYAELRTAARRYLLNLSGMTALGSCQGSQAMAIFYNLFEDSEKPEAFRVLVSMIEENDGLMDVGMLSGRTLFRVLSQFGRTDLAYRMITDGRYPSYAQWINAGATSLYEDFRPDGAEPASQNHHCWGDVSAWMIEHLAGICVNPENTSPRDIRIAPSFIDALDHVQAHHDSPFGRIESSWRRDGDEVILTLTLPAECRGEILLERGWQSDEGYSVLEAKSGTYRLLPARKKDKLYWAEV